MTSENPIPENNPTPHTSGKPDHQPDHPEPKVTPTAARSQPPPSHANYQVTCNEEKNWWDAIKPFVEAIGVILLAVYTGYTIKIYKANHNIMQIAQKTYDVSQRPYVGISTINVAPVFGPRDKNLKPSLQDAVGMNFLAEMKNFGPVPALNCSITWKVFINGIQQSMRKVDSTPDTVYPTEVVELKGGVNRDQFLGLLKHNDVLELEITIVYDGAFGHSSECTRHQLAIANGGFLDLGRCMH